MNAQLPYWLTYWVLAILFGILSVVIALALEIDFGVGSVVFGILVASLAVWLTNLKSVYMSPEEAVKENVRLAKEVRKLSKQVRTLKGRSDVLDEVKKLAGGSSEKNLVAKLTELLEGENSGTSEKEVNRLRTEIRRVSEKASNAENDLKVVRKDLREARSERDSYCARLDNSQASVEQQAQEIVDKGLAELQASNRDLQSLLERLQGEHKLVNAELIETASALEALQSRATEKDKTIETITGKLIENTEAHKEETAALAEARHQLEAAAAALDAANAREQQLLSEHSEAIDALRSERDNVRHELSIATQQQEMLKTKHAEALSELQGRLGKFTTELAEKDGKVTTLSSKLETANRTISELRARAEELQALVQEQETAYVSELERFHQETLDIREHLESFRLELVGLGRSPKNANLARIDGETEQLETQIASAQAKKKG